jgi:hypothetical protein
MLFAIAMVVYGGHRFFLGRVHQHRRAVVAPVAIEDRLGAGEQVGGSRRRLAFDEGESAGADAETLKISAGDVKVDLSAPSSRT